MITLIREDNRSFRFDAVIDPQVVLPGTGTQHPISEGAAASEHYQKELRTITFTGIVTATPMQSAGFPQVAGPERIRRAIEFLEETQGQFVTVIYAGRGIYAPCLLETLPHSQRDGLDQEIFDVTLKEMRVVRQQSVRIVLPDRPTAALSDEAPDTEDLGPQAPKQATTPDKERGSPAVEFLIGRGLLERR